MFVDAHGDAAAPPLVLLHGAGVPVLIPSPERYAIHKLIVGSRRKQDRDGTAKSAKDRLQARSIIEAMIENRQHADLASAFMEAWERGDQWRAAIRTSIATYDDNFQTLLRTEFAKGVSEFGSDPANYDLVDKSIDKPAPSPK